MAKLWRMDMWEAMLTQFVEDEAALARAESAQPTSMPQAPAESPQVLNDVQPIESTPLAPDAVHVSDEENSSSQLEAETLVEPLQGFLDAAPTVSEPHDAAPTVSEPRDAYAALQDVAHPEPQAPKVSEALDPSEVASPSIPTNGPSSWNPPAEQPNSLE